MTEELEGLFPEVNSREELVDFLPRLSQRMESGECELENPRTADFVEAASAWVDSCDGFFANFGRELPEQPDWSFVAMLFKAASVYE